MSRDRNWAVGILGGKESALLRSHVAGDIIENVSGNGFEFRIARDLKRIEIGNGELGLIVEHFLEMRHVPVAIDRVAVKTAAEMVVHPAGGHFTEGENIHF